MVLFGPGDDDVFSFKTCSISENISAAEFLPPNANWVHKAEISEQRRLLRLMCEWNNNRDKFFFLNLFVTSKALREDERKRNEKLSFFLYSFSKFYAASCKAEFRLLYSD